MDMILEDVTQVFRMAGFQQTHATKKVSEFTPSKSCGLIYLRKETGLPQAIRIVVAPDTKSAAFDHLEGVALSNPGSFLHSSNMRSFPKRMHTGENSIPHGIQFTINSLTSLKEFLVIFCR